MDVRKSTHTYNYYVRGAESTNSKIPYIQPDKTPHIINARLSLFPPPERVRIRIAWRRGKTRSEDVEDSELRGEGVGRCGTVGAGPLKTRLSGNGSDAHRTHGVSNR